MARFAFRLPDIGEGISEAEIVAWHVAVGDRVEEDEPLADMMTDKATVAMESPVAGTVVELAGEPGDQIAIGATLAVIETDATVEAAAPPPAAPVQRADTVAREPQPAAPKGPTHYDVLEVSPRASYETIEAAHRSLVKRYHPDVSKHKNAEERMRQINFAWSILGDADKRKKYDKSIGL